MPTVWKYPLEEEQLFTLDIPKDARILTVQAQGNYPAIWVLVPDIEAPKQKRSFHIYGTKQPIDEPTTKLHYIGTFFVNGVLHQQLVFHLFEVLA